MKLKGRIINCFLLMSSVDVQRDFVNQKVQHEANNNLTTKKNSTAYSEALLSIPTVVRPSDKILNPN